MTYKPKILAFAGSIRKDSFNKKILKIAAQGAEEAGADVTIIDLHDYPLPLYDQDIEASSGLPPNALKLKQLMREHQGLLIASPEYNSSISGVLKNTLDWISRPENANEPFLDCFNGKTAALMSASPGFLGGLRGLVHLRSILGNINVLVMPNQVTLSKANEFFDPAGNLTDNEKTTALKSLGKSFSDLLTKIHS
jgi:NAD(P)H-dependent FMN reductase